VCAFSTCRICGRTGLAVCRAINVGCSCPISDLSVRQSQRPPIFRTKQAFDVPMAADQSNFDRNPNQLHKR